MVREPSTKSYLVAVCLSAIFGVVGVHHFYLERYVEGTIDFGLFVATLYFFFSGQFWTGLGFAMVDGLHTFIITIMLLTGSFKDGSGKIICYPGQRLA
jgi:TM2 domain-containing membrane protein YozV